MPDKFRVGLIQMSATPDPDKNLQRAIDRLHQAQAKGAQIVCLPELFQTQYFCQREDTALFDLAEPIPGPTTARLAEAAKLLRIVLIGSLFEKRATGDHVVSSCWVSVERVQAIASLRQSSSPARPDGGAPAKPERR